MKAIAAILNGDEEVKKNAFADGLYIAGARYVMARVEGRTIYARSVRTPPPATRSAPVVCSSS